MKPKNKSPDYWEKVLTSIHGTYTLSNTEERFNEVDKLTVKHFLNTLAEIALAIASRKSKEG
ncbi:MAG: hypothetical protein ABSA33_05380 [Candidatus Micrarchaeaceae archaeon]|jgi:hypothetical protein